MWIQLQKDVVFLGYYLPCYFVLNWGSYLSLNDKIETYIILSALYFLNLCKNCTCYLLLDEKSI